MLTRLMRLSGGALAAFAYTLVCATQVPAEAECQLPFIFDVDAGCLRSLASGKSEQIAGLPTVDCDDVTVDRLKVELRLDPKRGVTVLTIEATFRVRQQDNAKVLAVEFALLDGKRILPLGEAEYLKVQAGHSRPMTVHYWIPNEMLASYTAEGSSPRLRVSMIVGNDGEAVTAAFPPIAGASFTPPALPPEGAGSGQVNFFIGAKDLDSKSWSPVDAQDEFGAVMTFGRAAWPIQIAVDALTSTDDETQHGGAGGYRSTTGSTVEIDIGIRKIWRIRKILPYVGGGLGYMNGTLKFDDGQSVQKSEGEALGIWVDTGVFFRLGRRFNIGMDLRWSTAPLGLQVAGLQTTAPKLTFGGVHFGLLLGWGW